jgi:winged helix DNA-binding protein
MRHTIHLVSARDYWPMTTGVRRFRRDQWLKTRHGFRSTEMASLAKRVCERLAGGVRRRDEFQDLVRGTGGSEATAWNGVGLWVDLVRVPPSGTWEQRRADLYALAEEWLGPSDATEEQGLAHLVRRYLGGFGPAPLQDVANWAGVPPPALVPTVGSLRLRRFRDESGAELLDLPRAPLPDGDAPAPVRFLPTWDATLLAHARRTEILPERHRTRVFSTKTPHSVSTFLVDGRVAGSWRPQRGGVALEPFERLPRAVRRELDDEAERLAAFLA